MEKLSTQLDNEQKENKTIENSTILHQGKEISCSSCCKTPVKAVCVKCGKYLCSECINTVKFSKRLLQPITLPESIGVFPGVAICKDDLNLGISPAAIIIYLLIGLTIASLFINWIITVFLVLLLIAIGSNKQEIDSRLFIKESDKKLKIFRAIPQFKFLIKEKLNMDFSVGIDGKKYADFSEIEGNLALSLKFDKDESKRYKEESEKQNFEQIHAGFLHFSDTEQIQSQKLLDSIFNNSEKAFALTGEIPEKFDSIVKNKKSFGIQYDYEAKLRREDHEADKENYLPFWIFPGKVESEMNSNSWGLEFQIANPDIQKVIIKSLTVKIPPELEGVEITDGLYESDKRQVSWENIKVTPEAPCSVSIQFVRPIHDSKQIEAEYEIEIDGRCLSGINVQPQNIWNVAGRQVDETKISIQKTTELKGRINIATRLQPKRQEVISKVRRVFSGIPLTEHLAQSIINAVSERDVYAKYIFEAPAITAMHEDTSLLSRYWEIIGRHYSRYQPYDVHIILTGEEPQNGSNLTSSFDLNSEIIIRGFTDIQFKEEKQDVEALSKDLDVTISNLIESEKNNG